MGPYQPQSQSHAVPLALQRELTGQVRGLRQKNVSGGTCTGIKGTSATTGDTGGNRQQE